LFSYGLGLTGRSSLPAVLTLTLALMFPPSAFRPAAAHEHRPEVVFTVLEDRVQSWREPLLDDEIRGLRLLFDTPIPGGPTLAVVHWAVRSNHRLDPFDALVISTDAIDVAAIHHLPYGFFCATLLQESAFDPDALSPAGAVGIAQFTLDTAADEGVDPFDWRNAIGGSGRLVGRYVAAYDGVYPDPYAATLAAYDAGPGTVDYYRGVPPYRETREYIGDIYDRWARILQYATGLRRPHPKARTR
jgi:hypothetical protein